MKLVEHSKKKMGVKLKHETLIHIQDILYILNEFQFSHLNTFNIDQIEEEKRKKKNKFYL